MLFSSSVFLFVFLPCVLLVYYALRRFRSGQNVFLFLASLVFYGWGEPKFLLLLLLCIAMNYGFGLWTEMWKERGRSAHIPVTAAAAANLSILFLFKYAGFTVRTIDLFGFDLTPPDIVLPIGISFFTFQAMSYVFDIALGRARAQRNPLNVGLYISLFPQLVAGPIVKYETVSRQITERKESWVLFSEGVRRFLTGLCKKVLLANQLAQVADAAFAADAPSAAFAWLGAVCYTLQIYFDFSGYSDMAIGLGRMFGFRFLENFNYPYIAKSVTEFWRRWHISLSTWFRDYVYIPLGGSRAGKARLLRNLFAVWLLTGIWHGAEWTFILWGLFYFVLLTIEKFTRLPSAAGHLYTLLAVNFAWVLFRADDLGAAAGYFAAMFGANGLADANALFWLREQGVFLVAGLLFFMPIVSTLRGKLSGKRAASLMEGAAACVLLLLFFVAVAYIIKGSYNPFIYFNF